MDLTTRGVAAAGAVLALMVGGAGCSAESDSEGATSNSTRDNNQGSSVDSSLGARGDALTALKAGTGATDGAWDGEVVTLEFREGSAAEPKATINCNAVNRLIAEDERAVLSYPDGEMDCEQARP